MVRLTIARLAALAMAFATASAAPMPDSHLKDESYYATSDAVAAPKHDATTSAHATATLDGYASHTTAPAMHDTTTVAHATTTLAHATPTTTTHGSGYTNWGGSGYDDCVQQCLAQYGDAPSATHTAAPVATHTATPSAGAPATGGAATHTVLVAPTQGLRIMAPFAVNAAVGDTIKFVWGANEHTVTKGKNLQLCTADEGEGAFASGKQNATFVFEQVVDTTEPTYYFCAVGTHCASGMYGIINPATTDPTSPTAAGTWMAETAQSNPDVAAMWSYTQSKVAGTSAENWGLNFDLSKLPEEARLAAAKNIMWTQTFYAANPGMFERNQGASAPSADQGIDIPKDISEALAAQPTGAQAGAPAPSAAPATDPSRTGANAPASTNDARSVVVSTAVVGIVALLASLFAL